MPVAFDTLEFAEALKEDDAFTPKQAEKLARVLNKTLNKELATKSHREPPELALLARLDLMERTRKLSVLKGFLGSGALALVDHYLFR